MLERADDGLASDDRAALMTSREREETTLRSLPTELIQSILAHLDSRDLHAVVHTYSQTLSLPAHHLSFQHLHVTSLRAFDRLMLTLEADQLRCERAREIASAVDEDGENPVSWGETVRSARIECTDHGEKGWGVRVGRLMYHCRSVRKLEVIGVEDFRLKSLVVPSTERQQGVFAYGCMISTRD